MSADHGHGGGHAPKASSWGGGDSDLGKGLAKGAAWIMLAIPAMIAASIFR